MKHRLRTRILAVLLAVSIVAGCAVDAGQKEQSGAVIGAILGGILGAAVTGGRNKEVGVLLGAALGGVLGGQIGRHFDEQDRKRIAEATIQALDEGVDQTYVSPKSGAQITLSPSEPTLERGPSIRVLPTVYTASGLRMELRHVFAARDLTVLASPSSAAGVTEKFARGEGLSIVASVPDSPYKLVARNGVGVGYATESSFVSDLAALPPLTKAAPTRPTQQKVPTNIATGQKPVVIAISKPNPKEPVLKSEVNRDATTATVTQATPPVGASQNSSGPIVAANTSAVQSVALTKECKTVNYAIKLPDGRQSTGAQKHCNEPPSGWKTVTA